MEKKLQSHFGVMFDFIWAPLRILFTAFTRPRNLHRFAIGNDGVRNSLIAVFWYVVFIVYSAASEISNTGNDALIASYESAVSIPFSLEILTIPHFLLILLIVWFPMKVAVKDIAERRSLVSLSIIVLMLAIVPYNALLMFPSFAENWQLIEPSSIYGVASGDRKQILYFALGVIFNIVLFSLNVSKVAIHTSHPIVWCSFASIIFLMVLVAWLIQPYILAIWILSF